LQKFVLRRAGVQESVSHAEVLEGHYGWKPRCALRNAEIPFFVQLGLVGRHTTGQHFSLKDIGEGRYRAAQAAVSKACASLERRGLVSRLREGKRRLAAVQITLEGRIWLSANTGGKSGGVPTEDADQKGTGGLPPGVECPCPEGGGRAALDGQRQPGPVAPEGLLALLPPEGLKALLPADGSWASLRFLVAASELVIPDSDCAHAFSYYLREEIEPRGRSGVRARSMSLREKIAQGRRYLLRRGMQALVKAGTAQGRGKKGCKEYRLSSPADGYEVARQMREMFQARAGKPGDVPVNRDLVGAAFGYSGTQVDEALRTVAAVEALQAAGEHERAGRVVAVANHSFSGGLRTALEMLNLAGLADGLTGP
jgi:hypothetical protein